jgi:hypothetical protein
MSKTKQPYVRPQVIDHGDIRMITRSSTSGSGYDGGVGVTTYVS